MPYDYDIEKKNKKLYRDNFIYHLSFEKQPQHGNEGSRHILEANMLTLIQRHRKQKMHRRIFRTLVCKTPRP